MIKHYSFEEVMQLFIDIENSLPLDENQIDKINIFIQRIEELEDNLVQDYDIIRNQIILFVERYKIEYLNHIKKYNEKIYLNIAYNNDPILSMIIPDLAEIRNKDDYLNYTSKIFNNLRGELKDIIEVYKFFTYHSYMIFFKPINSKNNIHNISNKFSEIGLNKHLYFSKENNEEKEYQYDEKDQDTADVKNKKKAILLTSENELDFYYEQLKKLSQCEENDIYKTKIIEALKKIIEFSMKSKNSLDKIKINLEFVFKLYMVNLISLQIFTFFQSMVEGNNVYENLSNPKNIEKKDERFEENDFISNLFLKENLEKNSLEDVVLSYFSYNSYEDYNSYNDFVAESITLAKTFSHYSTEASETEELVNKAQEVKNDVDKQKEATDENGEDESKKGRMMRKIKEKVSRVPVMMKTFSNKIRMFLQNKKTKWIFPKVRSKIDSMYERYGDKAIVVENEFKDDPVVILKDKLTPDIIRIGKEVAILCDQVEQLMKKASSMQNPEGVINLAKEWIKGGKLPDLTAEGEKMDKLSLKRQIVLATRARLVEIVMKNNDKIYGFTKPSCIVKALPPPNHFVVSYFLGNPQERPVEREVTSIFKSPDSFRIMATADKSDIFQVSELMNAVLKNKLDAETFERIEERRKKITENMKGAFKNKADDEIAKQLEKDYKECLKGFQEALEVMYKQKLFVAEIINLLGNMIIRIDKLCHKAILSMLAVEAEYSDPRYKGKLGAGQGLYRTKVTATDAERGR